jgi:putative effector of murein hydrolase LrgA (UPF0299 family)
MTTFGVAVVVAVVVAYLIGFGVGGWTERRLYRRRRGGYVRRVPMSSVHPREPKP